MAVAMMQPVSRRSVLATKDTEVCVVGGHAGAEVLGVGTYEKGKGGLRAALFICR